MNLFYSDKFKKSIPKEKKKHIDKLLYKFKNELISGNAGIFDTTKGYQSKKFHGTRNVFKFKVGDGDRIIFTYNDRLKNVRGEEEHGIYLFEYVTHDEQMRKSKKIEKNNIHEFAEWIKTVKLESNMIEEIDDEEANSKFNQYFDLESTITYLAECSESNESIDEIARINKEQLSYVMESRPQLLIGGAGSGKTLISIHKAYTYQGVGDRIGYFTLSEYLKNNAEEIFGRINKSQKNVCFAAINDYCLKMLGESEAKYVAFERFEKWIENKNLINIDSFNIWAEIRGIIKGYMGEYWHRNYIFSFQEYGQSTIKYSKEKGFIEEVNDVRKLRCTFKNRDEYNNAVRKVKNDLEISNSDQILSDLEKMFKMEMSFKYQSVEEMLISKSEYLKLNQKVSVFSCEEKEKIYDIAVDYQKWIIKEGLFDDNDLAAKMICKLNKEKEDINKFDYLVVDEVQDLTEVQIYLLSLLVRDLKNITFAGDIHQIINPTYYSNERLESFYYFDNQKLVKSPLTKNYRSQRSIVELSNLMTDIRKEYIAKEKGITELPSEAISDGNMLFYLSPNNENLKSMLTALGDRPSAVIVVSEQKERCKLENLVGTELPNIVTIQECKGLEFEYVFCYNLTSNYSEFWENIFDGKGKKNTKYRYYFNIFYVAITRARENLCIYEDINVFPDKIEFINKFIEIEEFDEDSLGLTNRIGTRETWISCGKEFEEKGKYRQAKKYFMKASSSDDALRCEARMNFEAGLHAEAIDSLLNLFEIELAYKYSKKANNLDKEILCLILLGETDNKIIDEKYKSDIVLKILEKELKDKRFEELIIENYFEPKMNKCKESILRADNLIRKVV